MVIITSLILISLDILLYMRVIFPYQEINFLLQIVAFIGVVAVISMKSTKLGHVSLADIFFHGRRLLVRG